MLMLSPTSRGIAIPPEENVRTIAPLVCNFATHAMDSRVAQIDSPLSLELDPFTPGDDAIMNRCDN